MWQGQDDDAEGQEADDPPPRQMTFTNCLLMEVSQENGLLVGC